MNEMIETNISLIILNTNDMQVTVMHSMQAGHMDKTQKYTDKALLQVHKLKGFFSGIIVKT